MREETVNSTVVGDDTDLTELVGHLNKYQNLVENSFTCKADYGNVTWEDAQNLTLTAFLQDYDQGDPNRRLRLLGWIKHYSLEGRFKKAEAPQLNDLHESSRRIKGLDARMSALSPALKNPWLIVVEAEKKKTPRTVNMRKKAIDYYTGVNSTELVRSLKRGLIATCSVTGCHGFDREVVAAHILPLGSSDYWRKTLEITDLNNLRNIVLLCKNIEKAFDRLQLCFLQGDSAGEYKLKIWDKRGLKGITLFDYYGRNEDNTVTLTNGEVFDDQSGESQRLITSYNGHVFRFPENKLPFSKILSYHVQESYKWALEKEWITRDEEDPPEVYGSPFNNDLLICHTSVDPLWHGDTSLRRGDTSTTSETTLSTGRRKLFTYTPGMAAQQTSPSVENDCGLSRFCQPDNAKIGVGLSIPSSSLNNGAARSVQRSWVEEMKRNKLAAFGILYSFVIVVLLLGESRAHLLMQQKTSKLNEINQALIIAEFAPHSDYKNDFWKKVFSLQSESSAIDVEIEKPMHDVIQNVLSLGYRPQKIQKSSAKSKAIV
mmetsp:Transcript_6030/g.10687  ORF Transcript_6030/g.10687 Transcript_6030/m.10687 type:complete len:544 (-) Transcript_6030:253-1884(-)